MSLDLPLIWAGIIAIAILAYAILDGFDLGIGILFPFMREKTERAQAMATIAPVWDGNETWLVLGGGGLLAAFPLAYAVAMTALYPMIVAMVLGLIFRGVAFKFIARSGQWSWFWEWGFAVGSIVATLAQGLALGTIVQGIEMKGRAYAGGNWDWLTPFTLLTALALAAAYALLGATWLIVKTEGSLQALARRLARFCLIAMMAALVIVSIATAIYHPEYQTRWLSYPGIVFGALVPVLAAFLAFIVWRDIDVEAHAIRPFLATIGLFLLAFVGLGLSFFPYMLPPHLTIQAAAGPDSSLGFLLTGTLVLLPLILGYTAYAYYAFRGKVRANDGYH